jgi:hypothetical protein
MDSLDALGVTPEERVQLDSAVTCYRNATGCLTRAMALTEPTEQTAMAAIAQAYAMVGLLGTMNAVIQIVGRNMGEEL